MRSHEDAGFSRDNIGIIEIKNRDMAYTWIPFYKEFGQKLLKYRDDRKPLVKWIYDNIDGSLIKHFKDDSSGKHVPDTDPFTVMA